MPSRDRFLEKFDSDVAAGVTDTATGTIIPNGETWQLHKIIFAHANNGNNVSGGFQIEYGQSGAWNFVTALYLTGSTKEIVFNKTFTGDGAKRFRVHRVNLDAANTRKLVVIMEGFKRLGE